jgi:hypothetical protein
MTEHEQEQTEEREPGTDEIQEEQTGKGYGDDEGEREEALEQQNFESL